MDGGKEGSSHSDNKYIIARTVTYSEMCCFQRCHDFSLYILHLTHKGLPRTLKKEALQFTYCFYFRGRQLFAISQGIVKFKLILPNHKEADKQIHL